MKHRTGTFQDWATFTGWLQQAEVDGWHLVGFQIVPKDARNDAAGHVVYAVIAQGK